jgi:hypothetical protein
VNAVTVTVVPIGAPLTDSATGSLNGLTWVTVAT